MCSGYYAQNMYRQISALNQRDVASERITAAGHSKGGTITILTADITNNPRVNFFNMAGRSSSGKYERQFRRFVHHRGSDVSGRVLSI